MNRRMTLGPLDSQMNRQGGGPQRSRMSMGGRQSLAPMMARKSNTDQLAQDMHGLSLSQPVTAADRRQSTVNGRTSISRRSSAYGRQSMVGGAGGTGGYPGGMPKDPRNIRDKQWMMAAIRNLVKFLAEAGYDRNISPKIFAAISAKDFQNIFKYLYSKLDPTFDWKNRKFEEEVPALMKSLKYPFADTISKTQLYAVGTVHAWPTMLALLVWMVELIMCCDMIETNTECDENVNQRPDQIFMAFLLRSYNFFLMGHDDFEAMEMELAGNFKSKDEWTIHEIERLKNENQKLTEEYNRLSTDPSPLSVYTDEKESFSGDIVKVKKWIESLDAKRKQLSEQISVLNEDISHKQKIIDETYKEKNELQEIVDSQELSYVDVDRMNAERDQLNKNIESVSEKIEEVNKLIWEREIKCQKKGDEVEKLAHDFNNKAYRLDLIPASAVNANGLNFELSLNHHFSRADEIITADLRGTLKRALQSLRQTFKNQILENEDKILASKETFEQMMEKTSEKLDEITIIESRLRFAQERYDLDKHDTEMATRTKTDEIESLERELRKIKVENTRDLMDAQKTAREYQLDYENLVRRTTDQKERLIKETLKALNDLVEMKTQLSDRLSILQSQLVENYETIVKDTGTVETQSNVDIVAEDDILDLSNEGHMEQDDSGEIEMDLEN